MTAGKILGLGILLGLVLTISGCSRPTMTLGKTAPPTFTMSGTNQVTLFQVSVDGNVIWKIYPKGNQFKLSDFGTISYGQVPPSCEQIIPKDQPAPALVEGKTYLATVVISDADALRTSFSIANGTIVAH